MIQSIKNAIKKKVYERYGYNLGLLKQKISHDFLAQQKLLDGLQVQTIIDAGANVGQTTLKYKKLFPHANIYAFEPFPESFQKLHESYKFDTLIKTEELALSDEEGFELLQVNNSVCTNSLLKTEDTASISFHDVDNQIQTKKEIKIKTNTLDNYCAANKIENIDILKMDVQGGELKILVGAKNLLENENISVIFTEVEFTRIYKDQPLFFDICEYLNKSGYTLYNVYNLHSAKNGQLVCGDAIFVSKKIRKNIIL